MTYRRTPSCPAPTTTGQDRGLEAEPPVRPAFAADQLLTSTRASDTPWPSASRPGPRLAAAGASNPEIADQLYVSRRTVEAHLTKIYSKLGINSRTQLAYAMLHDLAG